ncbi:transposase, Ptta/En/Spm [Artemisia annua]|uniref:Transposase, Ptta/En/Spm n=1 Tax=Artemisia annua TaxID=35608 RepID=A0A2U1KIP1_ARTAN|nr:transposase, Ptta/En/Spm [Artemisia annua]
MGNKGMHNQGAQKIITDYERSKMLRVQENQQTLRELGVKNIAKSLTSLAVAENTKKRKKKAKVTNDKDVEYNPEESSDTEENYQEISTHVTAPKKKNKDPNKEQPTLTQMFECTRERKEGNVYVDTYDDTAEKIEQMKNYKPPENESSPTDPFLAVMNKEYDGHRRLFGRGVTNTLIKKVQASEGDNGDDRHTKLVEVYERKIVELKEDNEKRLELMRKELSNERDKLVEDAVRKILEKLPLEVARRVLT